MPLPVIEEYVWLLVNAITRNQRIYVVSRECNYLHTQIMAPPLLIAFLPPFAYNPTVKKVQKRIIKDYEEYPKPQTLTVDTAAKLIN